MLNFSRTKIIIVSLICIFAILFSLPNFVNSRALPRNKVNLGLDLQGGSHLLLQIDFDYYVKEQLINLVDELKVSFRKERIRAVPKVRTSEADNRKNKEYISFTIKDSENIGKVKKIVKKINKNINVRTVGNVFTLKFTDTEMTKIKQRLMQQSIEIVRRRIDESGTKEPIIQAQGKNRILVQVPSLESPEQIKSMLGKTAKMTFHFVSTDYYGGGIGRALPSDIRRLKEMNGETTYFVYKKVVLTGDLLVDANTTFSEGEPAVAFKFNSIGARKFAKITQENVGRVFAIVLDDEVVTAPRINTPITGGNGIISGSFTVEEANEVALLLRAGALPAPLKVIEERTVGPSLGQDSIESGIKASIVGIMLVALFMFITYGFIGFFPNIALLLNMFLIIAVLSILGATLTLPGIAGIVLTMGMAVDANVLIFERIKEELRDNKRLLSAIDSGYQAASKTIFDSNITTLIIALILYIFGSGPVRGFAITLAIGITASMFSAILFTRMLLVFWLRKFNIKEIKI
jgi:protein-export membrane protein SecD